jgi:hypothetical protein
MNRSGRFSLRRWALLTLLLGSVAGATTPFTVRFGASGSGVRLEIPIDPPIEPDLTSFQLGFRVGALEGEDSLDMPYPGSFTPPDGGASLYFPAAALRYGLSQDYRPPLASQSWQLELLGLVPGSSVTLRWRLQDGSLAGNALSLVDLDSRAVLVGDMTTTSSYQFVNTPRSLLVLYSSSNHPPVARGDVAAMLQSAGALQIPFDELLDNDYDPDLDDTITVVAVGDPFVLPGGGKGASAYGTTNCDPGARMVTYTLPATLPADWDGLVYVPYTIRDSNADPLALHEGTATVAVTVAPQVLTIPTPALVAAHSGTSFTVAYTLFYTGTLHSLSLSFTLPIGGSGPTTTFWPYGGTYADDAATTAPPTIDSGAGPDGSWATADDTGVVILNFGTAVPPSGTRFSFGLDAPASASDVTLPSLASYRLTGTEPVPLEQPLPEIAIKVAYTVTFVAAAHGTITGTPSQLLEPGRRSTLVTAVPATGYHFLRWTQGGVEISRDNPLSVAGSTTDLALTAEFEINTYTITFIVSGTASGTLSGLISQNVPYLGSAAPVMAVPGTNAYFYQWTDGNTDNPRTITGVAAAATYTAEFRPLTPGEPNGHFDLFFQSQPTGAALRTLWDLTGSYVTSLGGPVLTLNLVHGEQGTLTGVGQLQGTVGGQAFLVTNLQVRGSSSGKNGSLTVRLGLTGANATTSVSLRLSLALSGRTLSGVASGSVTDTVGGRLAISAPCALDLPAAMDGTYRLPTDLVLGSRGAIRGTSTLTLANGRTVNLLVTGRRQGSQTLLDFAGDPAADPAFAAVSFKMTVRTYSSGDAGVRMLSGRAFGQILSWHL